MTALAIELAWKDWRHEWAMSLCLAIGVAAAAMPLLLLLSVSGGVLRQMWDELERDPASRELITIGQPAVPPATIARLRARTDVAFAAPQTRLLAPEERVEVDRIAQLCPQNLRERDSSYDYYVATVVQLGARPAAEVEQALSVVADRLSRAGLTRLARLLPALSRHVGEARQGPPPAARRAGWIKGIETA